MKLIEEFEVHNCLNPKLWNSDNTLKEEVRVRLLDIVEHFIQSNEVPLPIVDIHILGSQASYNYTKYSDLDLHIIANFDLLDASDELLQALYNALKTKFNSEYDISVKGIDVEIYVEDMNTTAVTNGRYSLYSNTWIKFPIKLDSIPQIDISDELDTLVSEIHEVLISKDSNVIMNKINDLYLIRKNSLDTEGEYGKGNLLFKEIRNLGLLDELKLKYKSNRSKELTLEHLILTEASRRDLLSKSKSSSKGFERFKKRVKSRIANSVKQYNAIDMNKLFKDNILTTEIQVKGETDSYIVTISFGGFLELLHDQIDRLGKFDLKAITRALITGFNKDDVFIRCSCPDNQYRFAYHQTKNKVIIGDPETRPSDITNPNDALGASCKHILLVLSNTSWILKVASVIYNYVNYMEKHYERLYQKVIYPSIYRKEYEEPVQLDISDLEDDPTLDSDSETIDKSNVYAKTKNQFKSGNEYRYKEDPNRNQLSIDDIPLENDDIELD